MKDSHKKLPIINKDFNYLLKKDFKPFMKKIIFSYDSTYIIKKNR